jgi:hypothetical protein
MARPAADIEHDPVLVAIGDVPSEEAFDDWLAGLDRSDEPMVLPLPAAQLIAEGRAEAE